MKMKLWVRLLPIISAAAVALAVSASTAQASQQCVSGEDPWIGSYSFCSTFTTFAVGTVVVPCNVQVDLVGHLLYGAGPGAYGFFPESGGTVSFFEGSTLLGTVPVQDTMSGASSLIGRAVLSWTFTTAGLRSITANYSGAGPYYPSATETYTQLVGSCAPPAPPVPTTKDQCKGNGWKNYARADGTAFKNEGDCIQYFNTGK